MPHVPSILNPSIIVLESNATKMLLAFQRAIALSVVVMKDIQVSMIPMIFQVSFKIKTSITRLLKTFLVECKKLINECANGSHECNQNAFCFDTKDSYGCICEDGFDGDGFNCSVLCFQGTKPSGETCIDINECEMNSTICVTPNTICKNSFGSYSCVCPDGFIGDAKSCTQSTMTTVSSSTADISASGKFIS